MRVKDAYKIFIITSLVIASTLCAGCMDSSSTSQSVSNNNDTITVTDALGRTVEVPKSPEHVICSGSGALRYLTYLEAQDRIVAVDSIETEESKFDARPYALANPQFKEYPVYGEFRGNDDPEKIMALDPQPQVIFKMYSTSGYDPVELQKKTGIPVIALNYGDMVNNRADMYNSLRIMGEVMGKEDRAEELIAFFDSTIADLNERTADVPEEEETTCYVGGIARSGPHGFQSTEPTYPPFLFINAKNVAYDPMNLTTAEVSKESILGWDPEIIFVDLSTTQSEDKSSALYQLQNDVSYRKLTAVQTGEVYGVLPYNWYTQNYGSVLADAYFAGKLLYPESFEDVDLEDKTIEIYTFLVGRGDEEVGRQVYEKMINAFSVPAFTKLDV
ncbi:MAG: corrinoid ABC transporter substrate-binding protein [Methanomethylovorans sp. PtaU1.Bin093]|uniref:iron ABC transporter substrate-binding protein n=1 Tax=Methanomethylovorans sp. PtaU1.Bin093 TaxID=1811679 RepID=UPI0009D2F542|nr:iron ABC transporter substrate-binding protein [Methanomethylovorans sp. PtaU1.Bin093]OPY21373.1 MAG: corrinoid ABC transporter substrate-binding protein [Methanomethylovorans sp. PtaU1.Bin093]